MIAEEAGVVSLVTRFSQALLLADAGDCIWINGHKRLFKRNPRAAQNPLSNRLRANKASAQRYLGGRLHNKRIVLCYGDDYGNNNNNNAFVGLIMNAKRGQGESNTLG